MISKNGETNVKVAWCQHQLIFFFKLYYYYEVGGNGVDWIRGNIDTVRKF